MKKSLDFQAANFLQFALSQGHSVQKLVSNPLQVAKSMNVTLTKPQIEVIKSLGEQKVKQDFKGLSENCQGYLREVIKDGRFLVDWKEKPRQVADYLGYEIDPKTIQELENFDLWDIIGDQRTDGWMAIAVGAAIVILVAVYSIDVSYDFQIVDFSHIRKL